MKTAHRVEKHLITRRDGEVYELLNQITHQAAKLYNCANFILREQLTNGVKSNSDKLGYNELDKLMQKDPRAKTVWPLVTGALRQQVLRNLDANWKGFANACAAWKEDKSKFLAKPKPPGFKKTGSRTCITFTNQQCKIKEGRLYFPSRRFKDFSIKLKKASNLKQVRIIPSRRGLTVEVVYAIEIPELTSRSPERICAIDLGLDNLAAVTTNLGTVPLLIDGKSLKSRNRRDNYRVGRLRKILDDSKALNKKTKQIAQIWESRHSYIQNYLHKVSRLIVDYCVELNIDTIVIGHNKNQKQKSRMKNFVQVPVFSLIPLISYKAEEQCIQVIEVNEAYTSVTSFLDGENPKKHKEYAGKRIKRGLYQSSTGELINSDVNGSFQIMKRSKSTKCKADALHKEPRLRGFVFNPVRVRIDAMTPKASELIRETNKHDVIIDEQLVCL